MEFPYSVLAAHATTSTDREYNSTEDIGESEGGSSR